MPVGGVATASRGAVSISSHSLSNNYAKRSYSNICHLSFRQGFSINVNSGGSVMYDFIGFVLLVGSLRGCRPRCVVKRPASVG